MTTPALWMARRYKCWGGALWTAMPLWMTMPRAEQERGDGRVRTATMMGHQLRQTEGRRVLRCLLVALLWVLVWQLASVAVGSELLLAGPLATAVRLAELIVTPDFWSVALGTLGRVAMGFSLALVSASLLAALVWRFRSLEDVIELPLGVLKSAPIVCLIVLLLMWLGSRSVVFVAVYIAVLPSLYFALVEGLRQLDPRLREMLCVHRVSAPRRLLAQLWPSLLPFLQAACRSACGMAWKSGVAAELVGLPAASVGERVYQSKLLLETADLFSWTITVIVLSWACERVFLHVLAMSGPLAQRLAVWGLGGSSPSGETCGSATVDVFALAVTLGQRDVLAGYELHLGPGQRLVLTDGSGAGKTTLLGVLSGRIVPSSGQARVRPGRVSAVFQETRLVEGLSAEENVLLACGRSVTRERARASLERLIPGVVGAGPVERLSGGQRRRVELVRALLTPSDLVLLDEPFAALDEAAHVACCTFVVDELRGRTLVVASHDPMDIERLAACGGRLAE